MATTRTRPRRKISERKRAELQRERKEINALAAGALADPDLATRVPAMLRIRGRFSGYSLRNQALLLKQADLRGITLTDVDTFKGWKERGRGVRFGEHGLRIVRYVGSEADDDTADDAECPETGADAEDYGRLRFRLKSVFDVSQTDGVDDADQLDAQDAAAALAMWDHLAEQVTRAGYLLNWPSDTVTEPAATDHGRRLVHIRADLDPAGTEAVTHLAAQLAAVLTHTADDTDDTDTDTAGNREPVPA